MDNRIMKGVQKVLEFLQLKYERVKNSMLSSAGQVEYHKALVMGLN